MEVFTVLHLFHIFMFHVKLIFNPLILIIVCTIPLNDKLKNVSLKFLQIYYKFKKTNKNITYT